MRLRMEFQRLISFPLYLWLLGIHPIVYLYSQNLGLVLNNEVVSVLGWMVVAITIAFLCINLSLKDRHKAAALIGTSLLFFSLSGHLYGLLLAPTAVHVQIELVVWTKFVLFIAVLAVYMLYRFGSAEFYRRTTKIMNLIMVTMMAVPSVATISDLAASTDLEFESPGRGARPVSPKVDDSPSHPDIYFIVPDGYPSDRWLQQTMNYDNAEFTADLATRGFLVADHAQSNYGATLHSLASTLNMQFFAHNESSLKDLDFLRVKIADNEIARQLRDRGYTYVQLLSGYLLPSPIADINRDFTPNGPVDIYIDQSDLSSVVVDGFQMTDRHTVDIGSTFKQAFIPLYFDTTLLRLLSPSVNQKWKTDAYQQYDLYSTDRFVSTIDELEIVAAMPEATFTFVHLLKPHGPLTFDGQGNTVDATWSASHEQYFAEFEFVNMKFLQMLDAILNKSDNEPVIIFQADHGSRYGKVRAKDGRLTHFDAYAAFYLPETFRLRLPRPFTLVNTFPIIFDEVFGTNYSLQDNRLFDLIGGYNAPFMQTDVTEQFLIR